jgi:diacylglycerol kinase (ATP)
LIINRRLHPLSKSAKDMGSAAQFLGLVIIALCWGVILI